MPITPEWAAAVYPPRVQIAPDGGNGFDTRDRFQADRMLHALEILLDQIQDLVPA